jgi:surface protein
MKIFFTPALLALVAITAPARICDARMMALKSGTGARPTASGTTTGTVVISSSVTDQAALPTIRLLQGQQKNHRELQITCPALVSELVGVAADCSCQAAFGTSIVDVACDFECEICEGGFGTGIAPTCVTFQTQFFLRNGVKESNQECFQYTPGRSDGEERLCVTDTSSTDGVDSSSCQVALDDNACNSCEWTECLDGSRKPRVDCSNLVFGGGVWNTCARNVDIPVDSHFAPLSRKYFSTEECYHDGALSLDRKLQDDTDIIEATPPPTTQPVTVTPPSGTVFNDETLRNAVLMWKTDRSRAIATYGSIGEWDVSHVTNMTRLFQDDTGFNDDISAWDVSSLNTMSNIFARATSFNQPLETWDVSSVTNMEGMFVEATSFNQPLDSWDTSRVETMEGMFVGAPSFDQPLETWNVSSVTNMEYMFFDATSFNQPLDSWDTSRVETMEGMFVDAKSFNQPLDSWDTSRVETMEGMFVGAPSFDQTLAWNTSRVQTMASMFRNAFTFNGDISDWDTSNNLVFDNMFESAYAFNRDLRQWNTSSARSMVRMFYNAESFDQELCWEVSQLPNVAEMFCATTASLDPNCTPATILVSTRCNGRDPTSPTLSPVSSPTGPSRPSSTSSDEDDDPALPTGIEDDDPALPTGIVFVIVLVLFVIAVVAVLRYCYWQLERVKERAGEAVN